jgi:hypothetical protein
MGGWDGCMGAGTATGLASDAEVGIACRRLSVDVYV